MKENQIRCVSVVAAGGGQPFVATMYWVLVLVLLLYLICSLVSPAYGCVESDRESLLGILSNISSSSPLSWNSSPDCCLWEGIYCDGGWVTRLELSGKGIGFSSGIPVSISNLTNLRILNLSHNRLVGSFSSGLFSSLTRLEVIDLSYNRLSGEFSSLFNASSGSNTNSSIMISTVDISSNRFNGEIPSSFFGVALNLSSFNVSNNSFTGSIPYSICKPGSPLRVMDFSYNNFSSQIPKGLGQCLRLEIFRAGFNSLMGPIPDDVYSAVGLREFSIPANHLNQTISNDIARLTNLRTLQLYSNQLTGTIPSDIGKLSHLERLELHINNLTGPLQSSLTNCRNITIMNLRVNYLDGHLSDFNFSTLTKLCILDLGNNNFTGNLPLSLYSCKSLTAIRLSSNQLEGQILPGISALESLTFLSLSTNKLKNFTVALTLLMSCKKLGTVTLSKNFMGEEMPDDVDIVGFENLHVLALGGCRFSGQVPTWLKKLKNLEVVDLSVNQFTGTVPAWLGDLPSLFYLDLSDNLISGEFPKELTRLQALLSSDHNEVDPSYLELPVFVAPDNATANQQYNQLSSLPPAIYLRNNSLSGSIPVEIGQLKFLHVLDLGHNNFSGNIPEQLSNLTNLEKLDLSRNSLSGEIPVSLRGLHFLSSFNVSYNKLHGKIPPGSQFDTFPASSFEGNPELCASGLAHHRPRSTQYTAPKKRSNTKLFVGLVLGICSGAGFICCVLVALWIVSKRRITPRGDTDKVELDTLSSNSNLEGPPEDGCLVILFPNNAEEFKDLTISEILKATDNFNQENIIGCGGFGLVYKATLANGTNLAVKKLTGDLGLMEREFKAEVEALSTAKHENLVALQGYCVHEGLRLLLYSFMENGSLDYWLHEKADGASKLDWPTRLKILQGASCGLAYMHSVCEPHIVHRDIKSSNILLDEKFKAYVADFGLSRLIHPYHTHVTTELVGTLGYIPPEYGQAWVATLRGDIYSFGVVMLELLTGKRPMEVFKPKMSRELVGWVQQMRSEGKQEEVFDPLMIGKGFEEEMLQVLDMACMCVSQNPVKRPNITEVVDWLQNVQRK